MSSPTFADFGFSEPVLAALARKGFEEPTPIQVLAIPRLLADGKHLLARARTGTGKTAAFGLPLVEKLSVPGPKVRALILVPTRELAVQVSGEIASFVPGANPRIATVYGGASMSEQLRRLSRGVDIVVGTPGRVIGDEMLDMGFIEDIEKVMEAANPQRRVVLFSATMPAPIMHIARKHLGVFEVVEDMTNPVQAGLTDQIWLEVRERDKLEALCRIVDAEDEFYGLVFCHTKIETDAVARALSERGYAAEALHGDVSQDMRERTLARFRDKKTLVLVATDVAARGIDVERLTHVVNFNLPFDPESYTHRIGRTGRAGNKGTAITFVTPEEYRRLFALRRASGDGLHKGAVPTVTDVIEAKRSRIKAKTTGAARDILGVTFQSDDEESDEVAAIDVAAGAEGVLAAEAGPKKPDPQVAAFYLLADELLAVLDPRDALASLAAAAYSSDLDPRRYGEVRDVSVDSAATARLYVGLGKQDGAWPKDVVAVVKRLTGLPDRLIDDIEVLERFSFVSVPFEAAEKAIAEARKQRGIPPVRIATPKSGPGGPKRSYGIKGGYDKPRPYRPRGVGLGDGSGGKPFRKPRPAN
jgi:ATP-dependent RNA helicase DeaD